MSTLPPHDVPAIFWIDGAGQQQGPEPLATVIERIAHDQIPSSTPVWWQGAVNWSPFNTNAELAGALEARLAPVPAPAPAPAPVIETASPFAASTASPFSSPSPSESTPLFGSPATFEQPVTFDAPAASPFEAPAPAAAPFEAPAPAAVPFEAPAPAATFEAPAPVSYDTASTFEAPAAPVTFDAPTATFDAPVAVEAPVSTEVSVVSDVPEVIVPDEPVVVAPSLQLGDTSQLESTFATLTERSAAFDAEVARSASLDETLAGLVRQALGELGFTIDESLTSDDYHSFRLSEPGGAVASLAIQRVPATISVAASVERPIACFVDRAGRASVGLFVGDYLTDDGTDQALFTQHLASVVNAAGNAG